MALVLAWLRLEARRRWRSLVVLGLLVALSTGVVITALAAARRGASALQRLHDRTLPTTVAVVLNSPGFDWAPVAELPEVAALTRFVVDYTFSIDGVDGSAVGFPFADHNFGRTLERPVVFDGRLFDPAAPDEAVVTRGFVSQYHKGVGDTVLLHLPSERQLVDSFTGARPGHFDGPVVPLHIVGVVLSPWISDAPDRSGAIQMSPGVTAKYRAEIIGPPSPNGQFVNVLVRLRHEGADIPQFTDDLKRLTGRDDVGLLDMIEQEREIQHQDSFESRCLVAFALAALLAAVFLVGQAITRYAAGSTAELQTLRALGLTPQQTTRLAAVGPAVVGVLGAAAGVLGAWVASSWFPFGTAGLFESAVGRQWDSMVMAPVALLVAVLVAVGAGAAARLAVRASGRDRVDRRSAVARAVGRTAVGVPLMIGTRFALESERGRRAIPVRPALFGAVIGVLGVVAAFTFSSGVSDAADHPERFGQTFELDAFLGINNQNAGPVERFVDYLLVQPEVTGLVDSRTAVATAPGGRDTVSLWEYAATDKAGRVVVLDGRLPSAADEVLLAPRTLAALDVGVGGTVTLTGSTHTAHALRVVGSGFTPVGPHNGYADGGWLSSAGFDAMFGTGFKFHLALISIRSGLDPHTMAAMLGARANEALHRHDVDIETVGVPIEVAEIREVRTLPIVLGGFLGLLAIGAVGHALATAVRRRSHDLAVLRALGLTPWQCRWTVITQASVLAMIGLLFGVPAGLALGRTVWRIVADYTPLQYVAPLAVTALLLVWPAALLLANLLATLPGRRAARLRISTVLRAE
ncbi:MAG: putative transport system permease protein [Pseudonocardiales bacterium]|nr:putative transport system permease protein [Pseudonocardiales bacterium]